MCSVLGWCPYPSTEYLGASVMPWERSAEADGASHVSVAE